MGFNYNLGDDQMRMINKFDKVSKNSKSEEHRFDVTTLPLAEQIKWLQKKKEKEAEAKSKTTPAKPIVRTTLRK
jgi:hypothetical protein